GHLLGWGGEVGTHGRRRYGLSSYRAVALLMRLEFTPEVATRRLSGARRWAAKRHSPARRTLLLPRTVWARFVQTQSTSLVRTAIELVEAGRMFVDWFVRRTVSEKEVSV